MAEQQVSCLHCKYYYITWDRNFPHGCRAMGFKGRSLPAASVRETSGAICLSYVKKDKGEGKKGPPE